MEKYSDKEEQASILRGSLLEFCRFFFKHVTGRDFIISQPLGRESHHITICRALTRLARLEVPNHRLLINVPPGYHKSTFVSMWIAWCWASFPDSQFLYISYSQTLAAKHTAFIKSVVSSRLYGYLFDVHLKHDSRAKDSFQTDSGGSVKAFGSGGAITGQDAGLPGLDRFSGGVIIDDPIKPDDVHSDTIRLATQKNYVETICQRVRGINVTMLFIGQRLREDDLCEYILSDKDITVWESVILQGIDGAGNALYPEVQPLDKLLALQEKSPYVFSSQIQQDPLPAGGGLFKPEWFVIMDEEPKMLETFITADTAETDKTYNDATVFSFFGVYEIETMGIKTQTLGLHWIDCIELRIEPKDLEWEFLDFWQNCMHYPFPPSVAAIEKKSTGVTLLSTLQGLRGMKVRNIDRTKASGSKASRYLDMQPFISSRCISLPLHGKHNDMCIKHMKKITANDTHRFDDICDTLYDGIKIALIDKTLYTVDRKNNQYQDLVADFTKDFRRKLNASKIRNNPP